MTFGSKLIVPGVAGLAVVAGLAGGSLLSSAAANAATSTSDTSTVATTAVSSDDSTTGSDRSKGGHTANGKTEEVLTGDTLTKAEAAAKAAVPGATVLRAETDAEGAAYEVHMTKSDGSEVTVKLDSNFAVSSTEDGMR